MYKMRILLYVGIATTLLLSSCQKDETAIDLDIQLSQAIAEASNGKGASYFRLPSSTDFNSIPQDPSNPLTTEKVELGKALFHETAFAQANVFPITMEEYSCASCHHAEAGFQAGVRQGLGEGGEGFGLRGEGRLKNALCDASMVDVQPVRTPSAMNGAFQPLMLWNGQFGTTDANEGTEDRWKEGTPLATNKLGFEGLETQAIAGMGVHRLKVNEELVTQFNYKEAFDEAFPDLPESERYSNITAGLALAAYERTVLSNEAPWQQYLRGNTYALSDYEKEGAILFLGKAQCVSCHTGPALNDMKFHALGMGEFDPAEVFFYNPEDPSQFGRYSFTGVEADRYKFKTPQLYNLRHVNFYGHGGTFTSVEDVIAYKNEAVPQVPAAESQLSSNFSPKGLTVDEVKKIAAFVTYGLEDGKLDRYVPSELPSGNCFPNNDGPSREDLGCE